MSQPFGLVYGLDSQACLVCGVGRGFTDVREGLCVICGRLIPGHIPSEQYKRYVSSLLFHKYNHKLSYRNKVMSKKSQLFLSRIVGSFSADAWYQRSIPLPNWAKRGLVGHWNHFAITCNSNGKKTYTNGIEEI